MSKTLSQLSLAAVLSVSSALPAAPEELFLRLRQVALRQLSERKQRVAAITTQQQFEPRRAEVRRLLLRMMGGLPERRTALNLRRMGTLERGDYRVEKVVYESQPNFYVTANLYVPAKGKPPYAAVVQPTGHSLASKSRAFYQTLALGLVKQGFVVLTYDPTGQGERRIFFDRALGDSLVGNSTTVEHSMVGIQSLFLGESIARYMVWDGMRAIDVLQSLPYVDPQKIGVSGCSGGGTLTAYLAALDDRLQAAAPSCYITDWEDQILGTGPQDAEQQFPRQFEQGLNHADLVEAFAPKPYLICSTTEDFFPIAGSRKTFEESKRIYELFGAGDRIGIAYDSGPHGTTKKQREAIYAWMRRWLRGESGEISPEPAYETEYEDDLRCTPTGQLSTSLGGETPSTLNIARLSAVKPMGRQSAERLVAEIKRLTRWEAWAGPLDIRASASTERDGIRLTPLSFESAPGWRIEALLVEPPAAKSRHKSVLYIADRPGSALSGDLAGFAQLGYTALALRPSGIGERNVNGSSSWGPWFGNEGLPWLALMVGKPLVGLRIQDIVRGVDVLRGRGLLFGGECVGFAKGRTLAADLLHAAVLDRRIAAVALEDSLLSYASIVRTPLHQGILEMVIPGVIGKYDLPDLVAALAPRPLCLLNVKSPMAKPVPLNEVQREYERAQAAYSAAGAAGRLRLGLRREEESLTAAYPEYR
jgi:cephalosporin-C deacetylase-like acetyl esterase